MGQMSNIYVIMLRLLKRAGQSLSVYKGVIFNPMTHTFKTDRRPFFFLPQRQERAMLGGISPPLNQY